MTRAIQIAVEREYGEPFWTVVRGYADAGESMTATAAILGYASHSGFRRLVDRHGVRHWFCTGEATNGAQSARDSRRGVMTPAMRRALVRANAALLRRNGRLAHGIVDTVAGHARRCGVSVRTVYHRLDRGQTLEQALSRESQYVRPDNRGHWWRRAAA